MSVYTGNFGLPLVSVYVGIPQFSKNSYHYLTEKSRYGIIPYQKSRYTVKFNIFYTISAVYWYDDIFTHP